METTTLYAHPDGPALIYAASTLIAADGNGNTVKLPIGRIGLLELADALQAIANDGEQAEEDGGAIALDCLDLLLVTDSQGERIRILQNAIIGLQSTIQPERAIGGFCVAIENVIERGLGAAQ